MQHSALHSAAMNTKTPKSVQQTNDFRSTSSDVTQNQGVLHNHGGDSFFQKEKSCISPKLLLKSILLFYKDLLEIKSCLLDAILELKLSYVFEKMELKVYSNGCYKMLTLRTLSVGQLYSFAF